MGNVVVLIGAGSIGRAIARRVASGHTLLVADLREDAARAVVEAFLDDGFDARPAQVDVSDADSVAALVEHAASLGAVTHVIHAAGVSPVQASAQAIVAVDVVGTALVLEEFGRLVAPGGAGIVIASQAGYMLPPLDEATSRALARTPARELAGLPALASITDSGHAYSMAKRANILRVQAAALTWGDRGARVNSISPGIIMTPLARDEMSGPGAAGYRAMLEASPAKRVGTPDEIGQAAAFMMGATFLTGADLLIDGGVIAAIAGGRYRLHNPTLAGNDH